MRGYSSAGIKSSGIVFPRTTKRKSLKLLTNFNYHGFYLQIPVSKKELRNNIFAKLRAALYTLTQEKNIIKMRNYEVAC